MPLKVSRYGVHFRREDGPRCRSFGFRWFVRPWVSLAFGFCSMRCQRSSPPARTDFIEWRDVAMLYVRRGTGLEVRWQGATIWPRGVDR